MSSCIAARAGRGWKELTIRKLTKGEAGRKERAKEKLGDGRASGRGISRGMSGSIGQDVCLFVSSDGLYVWNESW